jgi:hypothetical protein
MSFNLQPQILIPLDNMQQNVILPFGDAHARAYQEKIDFRGFWVLAASARIISQSRQVFQFSIVFLPTIIKFPRILKFLLLI